MRKTVIGALCALTVLVVVPATATAAPTPPPSQALVGFAYQTNDGKVHLRDEGRLPKGGKGKIVWRNGKARIAGFECHNLTCGYKFGRRWSVKLAKAYGHLRTGATVGLCSRLLPGGIKSIIECGAIYQALREIWPGLDRVTLHGNCLYVGVGLGGGGNLIFGREIGCG